MTNLQELKRRMKLVKTEIKFRERTWDELNAVKEALEKQESKIENEMFAIEGQLEMLDDELDEIREQMENGNE